MKKQNNDLYALGELPYPESELEPYISRDTLYYHYNFHHRGYVNKLNDALLKDSKFCNKYNSIQEVILNYKEVDKNLQSAIKNNAGGHLNHTLFWTVMCSHRKPEAFISNYELINHKISESFGSYDKFVKLFQEEANKLFGSGWVWLVINSDKRLKIVPTSGHDNPISNNLTPILVIDVWEHAYYLDYKNNRSKFIESFFKIINWAKVENLYKETIAE